MNAITSFYSVNDNSEKIFFAKNGYIGPFSLPNNSSIIRLIKILESSSNSKVRLSPSNGSAHIFSKPVFSLATEPSILERVSIFLGPNSLLWIGQVLAKKPGGKQTFWHIDEINYAVGGIHVSVAITDMNIKNGCLQVIPGTHKYKDDLQEYAKKGECDLSNAESILQLANRLHPENAPHQIVPMEIKAGQYFFTKGGLWHNAVDNLTDKTRLGFVARYMRTDVKTSEIKFGDIFDYDNYSEKEAERKIDIDPLPCILVSGEDQYQFNTLYNPPKTQLHAIYNKMHFNLSQKFKSAIIKEIPLKHKEMLKRSIAELTVPERELEFDIYCPSLESEEIHSRFPVDSSMLN